MLELIRAVRIADASNAELPSTFGATTTDPQDHFDPDGRLWGRALAEITRLTPFQSIGHFMQAFGLAVVAAPDAELPGQIGTFFREALKFAPQATLWSIPFHRWLFARRAIVGALFNAYEAPELLGQTHDSYRELEAGRGLGGTTGFTVGPMIQPVLQVTAPWALGFLSGRAGGLTVLLYGQAELGRIGARGPELLEAFRQDLLTTPPATVSPPEMSNTQVEVALRWWTQQVNDLLVLLLDPSHHVGEDGLYDATAHYGWIVSIDRLFAAVNTILVSTHRDGYTALEMLFIALDIIHGLTGRKYTNLLSARVVSDEFEHLRQHLSDDAAAVLLPRCQSGMDGLNRVREGFFLPERVSDDRLAVAKDDGHGVDQIALDRAVADYLNLVRNGGHSFRMSLRNRRDRSLMSAHNGRIPPEVADIAFLHLLALLADPGRLLVKLMRAPG